MSDIVLNLGVKKDVCTWHGCQVSPTYKDRLCYPHYKVNDKGVMFKPVPFAPSMPCWQVNTSGGPMFVFAKDKKEATQAFYTAGLRGVTEAHVMRANTIVVPNNPPLRQR